MGSVPQSSFVERTVSVVSPNITDADEDIEGFVTMARSPLAWGGVHHLLYYDQATRELSWAVFVRSESLDS